MLAHFQQSIAYVRPIMTVHRMHALRPWREESFKRRLNRINLNIFTVIMISFFGLLFILCFGFVAIVNFYGAASVARPCSCR